MIVGEIMTTKVSFVAVDATIEDAISIMRKEKVQTMPVVGADRLFVGMFTVRLFLKKALPAYIGSGDLPDVRFAPDLPQFHETLYQMRTAAVSTVMNTNHPTVVAENSVLECAALLTNPDQRIRSIPVVDTANHLIGIVTGWDIIKELYREEGSGLR
ncbi:MAG TPA: CBS domain-containing protein [Nitrospirales bacterium]|nr:CBS domain-containing protein [Nitrospirales bacterium]